MRESDSQVLVMDATTIFSATGTEFSFCVAITSGGSRATARRKTRKMT